MTIEEFDRRFEGPVQPDGIELLLFDDDIGTLGEGLFECSDRGERCTGSSGERSNGDSRFGKNLGHGDEQDEATGMLPKKVADLLEASYLLGVPFDPFFCLDPTAQRVATFKDHTPPPPIWPSTVSSVSSE